MQILHCCQREEKVLWFFLLKWPKIHKLAINSCNDQANRSASKFGCFKIRFQFVCWKPFGYRFCCFTQPHSLFCISFRLICDWLTTLHCECIRISIRVHNEFGRGERERESTKHDHYVITRRHFPHWAFVCVCFLHAVISFCTEIIHLHAVNSDDCVFMCVCVRVGVSVCNEFV